MVPGALEGCRVLVVEDELAIAMLLENILEDEKCQMVGPYSTVRDALVAARGEQLDLAVLDMNLAGEMVFPVADALAERGVPFLILSGYGNGALPANRRHWPVCGKPFKLEELVTVMASLIGTRSTAAS